MRNAKWLPQVLWMTAEAATGATAEAATPTETDDKTAADTLYPDGEKPAKGEKPAEEEKAGEGEAADGEKKEGEGEPEPLTVEALTVPEGVELSPEVSGKFVEILNNAELSPNDRANALLELQADAMKAASEQSSALWQETQQQWQDEVRNDPEIGGEKLDQNLANVRKFLDEYGSPELDDVMAMTGVGNNIHMARFMVKLAKNFTEGQPLSGRPASQAKDAASVLYPNQGI